MKRAAEWKKELAGAPRGAGVQRVEGRGGQPTLKAGGIWLHSRYNPEQEAQRLVDSAELREDRPVLVVGLALGYHVRALLARDFEVAVAEPDRGVAKLALAEGLGEEDFLLAVGADADAIAGEEAFGKFAARLPQLLIHPPTARLHPRYCEAMAAHLSKAALHGQRLNIAIVGPLYGGSLPISEYLARAFEKLGHRALLVDNRMGWELHQAVSDGVQTDRASAQLGEMLTNFLAEWSYARVVEFDPEICIVMAQAPVGPRFPERLAKKGIVPAYWFVENWRHMGYWKTIAPYYDYFFHIQPGEFEARLEEAGCPAHAFVQTGCDPELHKPIELSEEDRAEYAADLSFAGAGYYNRIKFFQGLCDYDFKIWGVDWADRNLAKLVVGGERRFDAEMFSKIVAGAKINFNLHSSTVHDGVDPKCDAINPRVFEIAAAGGFQLCDPCAGLEDHFDFDTELPVYRDLKECRAKLDRYLAHPEERAEAAKRARARVLKDHTYEHRAQAMLDLVLERHGGRILKKGVRVQRTVAEMAKQAPPDSTLAKWLDALPPDLLFTHESIKEYMLENPGELSYPEKIFMYMAEMFDFAEMLLKAKR